MRVDLFLDGQIGEWILNNVDARNVGHVITTDTRLEQYARQKDFRVILGSPRSLTFQNQPIGFSGHYHRVFPPDFLSRYSRMYNLHPGFLPWGRGYYPIFWALWEETPAGATLHEITAEVDEGPVVAQIQVPYSMADTGETLFERVREAERQLFLAHWPRIASAEPLPAVPQTGPGSCHSKAEFLALKENVSLSSLSGTELMRLIRALSFSGYSGLEVQLGDRRFDVTMKALNGR
ncbi:MAG TPA: formyltransferase family protein [Bryobacteraceae bacterium]|jgi:methionyl-tRNA formyltransferase|nr:formyltransferase family protein [Bryobacteraceae bacterium]